VLVYFFPKLLASYSDTGAGAGFTRCRFESGVKVRRRRRCREIWKAGVLTPTAEGVDKRVAEDNEIETRVKGVEGNGKRYPMSSGGDLEAS